MAKGWVYVNEELMEAWAAPLVEAFRELLEERMESLQKNRRVESFKYLKWIRQQPCSFCGGQSEPHHLRSVGLGTGTGYKASDILTLPVCRNHHEQCHNGMVDNETQMLHCLRTINKALAAGVIEIK